MLTDLAIHCGVEAARKIVTCTFTLRVQYNVMQKSSEVDEQSEQREKFAVNDVIQAILSE